MKCSQSFEICLEAWAEARVKGITAAEVSRCSRIQEQTDPELHSVSPPNSGPVMTLREVTPGG